MKFSEMSAEECWDILDKNCNNLNLYTTEQIQEMCEIPRSGITTGVCIDGIDTPMMGVMDKDGGTINTNITIEEYNNWKNK